MSSNPSHTPTELENGIAELNRLNAVFRESDSASLSASGEEKREFEEVNSEAADGYEALLERLLYAPVKSSTDALSLAVLAASHCQNALDSDLTLDQRDRHDTAMMHALTSIVGALELAAGRSVSQMQLDRLMPSPPIAGEREPVRPATPPFPFEMLDDSNAPRFPAGVRLIFDPSIEPKEGDIVMAWSASSEHKPIVGKLSYRSQPSGRCTVVTPLNEAWPAVESTWVPMHIIATMTPRPHCCGDD